MRMQATKLGMALHRRPAIDADIDHRDAIDDATIILGARVQSLDHEPLIGMSITHVGPAHGPTVRAGADRGQLSDQGGESRRHVRVERPALGMAADAFERSVVLGEKPACDRWIALDVTQARSSRPRRLRRDG